MNENYENYKEYNQTEQQTEVLTPVPEVKKKKSGKGSKLLGKLIALILCGALFGGSASAAFYGVNTLLPQSNTSESAQSDTSSLVKAVSFSSSESGSTLSVCDVAEGVMPAMVSITNISVEEVQSYYSMFGMGGQTQTQESQSSGSGIIIGENDTELLIVTNNHVVEDADTLTVSFSDGNSAQAEIKGTDSDNDLAVIAVALADISSDTLSEIKIATLGNSDELKVGEQVVAIGNALGYGQSVTTGIVSALNRQVDTTDSVMIQTDAAINPGNSGGALLNMNGEVIGINSAKYSSTEVEGMGYAISISAATPIIEELMNRTTRTKVDSADASYLGIYGQSVTASVSSAYGIPEGIYVTSVTAQSPAYCAGITEGCIITRFDGTKVEDIASLKELMEYYAAGETVSVTMYVSDGKSYTEKEVSVTLGSSRF